MLTLGANGTAIMAALPTMGHDFGLSATEVGWAINAYLVVSAACIIPGGRAGDQVGAGRVSMAGLGLFAVASVVVATAHGPSSLLVGRALQGLAAALAVPGTLAVIGEASTPERRAGAIGAWAGFLMLGFSMGPLIGGVLTHYVDWRMIFWASAGLMLLATGVFVVSRDAVTKPPNERVGGRDWAGFVLLAIFMAALVSALHALPGLTRAPLDIVGLAALATVSCVALLAIERRVQDPLIDLGLFTGGAFLRAVAAGSVAMSSILAMLLYYNLDAQSPTGLSLSPVGAGLSLLPMSGGRACCTDLVSGGGLSVVGGQLPSEPRCPVPFKAKADSRHHIPRQQRRVTNWRDYDASLRQRGSLTVWFTDDAIAAWAAEPRTTPGGQPWYSPLAILTGLTLCAVFRLAFRQTEGLIGSIVRLLGLTLAIPDHTTLCRRAETLEVAQLRRSTGSEPVHLLVDSTGLKLRGAGEWLIEKHGTKTRRAWKKLHIGVDGQILASTLTGNEVDDGSQADPLLDQVTGPLASFTGDGAYDRDDVCTAVIERHPEASIIVPPRSNAVPSGTTGSTPTQRDHHLQFIAEHGRTAWQKASGYTKRARVEAAIGRFKRVIGDGLRARTDRRRATEVQVAVRVLNRMLELGRPNYVRTA